MDTQAICTPPFNPTEGGQRVVLKRFSLVHSIKKKQTKKTETKQKNVATHISSVSRPRGASDSLATVVLVGKEFASLIM